MATPVADSYGAASGAAIYGGRFNLPAWVPPVGYFADVPMVNTSRSVVPAIYSASFADQQFDRWGGSALIRDFSSLGAQVFRCGGHESANGITSNQGELICDFSSLQWSWTNVPNQPNPVGDLNIGNGKFPDGTVFNPHSYHGLLEYPTAWGGGPKGSLLAQMNSDDGSNAQHLYALDLTNQFGPSGTSLFAQYTGVRYFPTYVKDEARQGYWTLGEPATTVKFISKTSEITSYPAAVGSVYGSILVHDTTDDFLIVLQGGYFIGPNADIAYRRFSIYDIVAGTVTQATTAGKPACISDGFYLGHKQVHSDFSVVAGGSGYAVNDSIILSQGAGPNAMNNIAAKFKVLTVGENGSVTSIAFADHTVSDFTVPAAGYYVDGVVDSPIPTSPAPQVSTSGSGTGVSITFSYAMVKNLVSHNSVGYFWSPELDCMIGLDTLVNPPEIVKLTPPATNRKTGVWTYSRVQVAHWPDNVGGKESLAPGVNGNWSKMIYNQKLNAFVFCANAVDKPQVIRLF